MGQPEFTRHVVQGWARIRPDEDLSVLSVVQRLIWSGRLAEKLLERAAIHVGLRHRGDYEVLALMRRSEPKSLTPAEVAEQVLSSASGMTGKVDRLEDQGFLERQSDPRDRRVVKLALTETGRVIVDRVFSVNLSMYRNMLDRLTLAQQETLDETLEIVLARLEELSSRRTPWSET